MPNKPKPQPKAKKLFQDDFKAREIHGVAVPLDETHGWHPDKESLGVFSAGELPKAKKVWEDMPSREADGLVEWAWLMWMWARRTRRDILVLEEYLTAEYNAGNLDGEPPYYADPGDPPPPPDGFF